MASSKALFKPALFAGSLFAPGVFRGSGVTTVNRLSGQWCNVLVLESNQERMDVVSNQDRYEVELP